MITIKLKYVIKLETIKKIMIQRDMRLSWAEWGLIVWSLFKFYI